MAGLVCSSTANDQFIRGMIGVGTAIITNEISKQAAPKPPRSPSSPKSNAKKNASGKGGSGAGMNSSDLRAVQIRLNELGFNAGNPDGAMGPGTRQAIKRWQSANGLPVTGRLDVAQVQAMMSADTVVAAGGVPPEEPPLTRAEVSSFQAQLNQLGYPVGRPDGVAGPQTGRAIARFLRDRGYDPYQVSARAALQFALTGEMPLNPMVATGGTQQSIFGDDVAADGGAVASASENPAPVEFDPADYIVFDGGNRRDREAFDRDIVLRLMATTPSIIEDDGLVSLLFEAEHPSSSKPGAESDLATKYWQGTQFDREDALTAYRASLAGRAIQDKPLKVAFRIGLSGIGNYVEGAGFRLDFLEYDHFQPLEFDFGNLLLRRSILMVFPDAPMIDSIPADDEAEARDMAERLAEVGSRSLWMYVTIDSVGPETVGESIKKIRAHATLDGIVLAGRFKTGEAVELYRWEVAPSEAPAVAGDGLDVAQSAAFAGLPMLGGRLLALAERIDADAWQKLLAMAALKADTSVLDDDEVAFAYAAIALTRPEMVALAQGEDLSDRYGTSALRGMNEFARRSFMARLRSGYLPRVLTRTPNFPLPAVEVFEGNIGEYDFDKENFSLQVYAGDGLKSMSDYAAPPFTISLLDGFPDTLALPADRAEQLVRLLASRGQDRRVYLAVYSSLDFKFGGRENSRFVSTPERIALFADKELTGLIAEFDVASYLRQAPPPEDASVVAARASVQSVLEKPIVRSHMLAALARDYPTSQGFFEVFVDSASSVRGANEFNREDVRSQIEQAILNSPPANGEMWLTGEITLGQYDTARGGFPIASVSHGFSSSEIDSSFYADIKISMSNLDALDFLPMASDEAQQLVADQPSRTFAVRMRMVPQGANWDPEEYGTPRLELIYDVAELYALDRSDRESVSATKVLGHLTPAARTDIEAPETAASNEGFGERAILTQDMLYTIAAHSVADRLDDDAIDWLLVNRFANDTQVKPSWPSRFFSGDARPPVRAVRHQFAEPYREWLGAQTVELPEKLTLVVERKNLRMQHPYLVNSLLRSQCHHLSIEPQVENMPPAFGRPPRNEVFEAQVNYPGSAQYQGLEMALAEPAYFEFSEVPGDCAQGEGAETTRKEFGLEAYGQRPVVLVEVDRVPLPLRHSVDNEEAYMEIDVTVDGIEYADNGNGVPHVHLKAIFEEIRTSTFSYDQESETSTLRPVATITRAETIKQTYAERMDGKPVDILGITVGQTMADAEAIVIEHLGNPTILDAVVDGSDPGATFEDGRLYIRPDGYEQITLFRDPAPGRQDYVIGVSRGIIAAADALPAEALLASLRAKFGAEDLMDTSYGKTSLIWGDDVARGSRVNPSGKEETDCQIASGHSPNYWMVNGRRTNAISEFVSWNEVRNYLMMVWPGIPGFGNATRESCGVYVRADIQQHEKNSLWMFVTDLGAYSRGVIERRANPPAPSAATAPDEASPLPDVKL